MNAKRVGADVVGDFERDGYTLVKGLLSQAQVASTLAAMERIYAGRYTHDRRPPRLRRPVVPMGSSDSVHWVLNSRILDADLWSVATCPEIGANAATLLRTSAVSIVEDQLLAKPPGGRPVNVHQDYSYWSFSRSTQMITAWVALVDMTPEMGPLQLLRGSHRWAASARPRELIRGSENDWLEGIEAVRPVGAEIDMHTLEVAAGDAIFLHSLTFHGSSRNASDRWRRAMSLHWAAEECRVDLGATAEHDHPFFFARLEDGGPIVNDYMPITYRAG
jgi:ectoine hydroxylase-related dioxygenase (phytanoyl-CoA dioxygenase family)